MNDNDISGRILTAMETLGSDWVHLCLPAEFDPRRRCFTRAASARPVTFKELENTNIVTLESPYGAQRRQLACRYTLEDFQDPRTEDMSLLNPLRFGRKEIDEIKNGPDGIGEWRFSGQYNQDPVPREGAMFPRESFMRYTKPPIDDRNRLVVDEWLMSWDMAFKELSDNDFVVGTVWVRKGIDYYLVDVSRGRRSVSKTCAAVIDLSNKWPMAVRKLVEDKANGPAVIDLLKDRVPGLEPVEPLGGKLARANAVEPIVASRHVWIPDHTNKNGCWWPDGKPGKDGKHGFVQMDTTWVENYLKEMERFPKATFDDQVDSTTQAINWWIPRVKLSFAKPVSIGMSPSMWAVQ
jgi:predicted phage terminase large subunit-like protein